MSVSRRELFTLALSAGLVTACTFGRSSGQSSRKGGAHFGAWPQGSEPKDVGKRVAQNFLARKFTFQTNPRQAYVVYSEICAWYGSLQVAALTRDTSLDESLIRKFDYFLTSEGEAHIGQRAHVDFRIFGAVPLEIYQRTQQAQYLELGRSFAEKQWEKTTPDGISTEARYWSDDLYMLPLLQAQAYRATGDQKYLDRAALTMVAYLEKLQQANGLFLHSADSPFYWARGNGWVAAGMTEMLTSLPENHPQRTAILESYRKMLAALLPYQTAEGMWRQVIDQEDFWAESSGTGMFTFAMVTGVKQGWLDASTYAPAARKAWLALVSYLDESANIREVCAGTNKAQSEVGDDPAAQRKYYFDRPRRVGDLHGQAPLLWTSAAFLR
jgi:rhamnogalacturonyl hydrolase YesR